jgi:hypothetical protein
MRRRRPEIGDTETPHPAEDGEGSPDEADEEPTA